MSQIDHAARRRIATVRWRGVGARRADDDAVAIARCRAAAQAGTGRLRAGTLPCGLAR